MNIQKKQSGFTLVELITVVSMLALLTVFVARELGQSSDDVKLNLAGTALISAIPAAVASYKARNFGNCNGITKADLVARAAYGQTPWGVDWTLTAYTANSDELEIVYPLTGSSDPETAATGSGATLAGLLAGNPVFSADPIYSTPSITAKYTCT